MTLADKLRSFGCNVVEMPGWQDATYRGRSPRHIGTVGHHDVSPRTRDEYGVSLSYLEGVNQGGGRFVPGPLYNITVGKDTVYLLSRGYTNNAGKGNSSQFKRTQRDEAPAPKPGRFSTKNGNPYYFGICLLNDGVSEPVPATQLDQYLRAIAAVHAHYSWSERVHVEHREWTRRKIDPSMLPLPGPAVRDAVGLLMLNPSEASVPDVLAPLAKPDGSGRLPLFSADPQGNVKALNGAEWRGDLSQFPTAQNNLAAPVVAIVPTPTGRGYWLIGGDGGVFNFGDAKMLPGFAGAGIVVTGAELYPDVDNRYRIVMTGPDGGGGVATFKVQVSTGFEVPTDTECPELPTAQIVAELNEIRASCNQIESAV